MERDQLTSLALGVGTYPACVDVVADFFAGSDIFLGHGTDTPEDEAHWLVAACLGWDEARWQGRPEPAVLERIASLALQRVVERVPLAYLVGEAWFAGLRFAVDRSVLVPRSPLAELIENSFAPWARLGTGDRVLEIGTGCGCIAIATAVHLPEVTVVATDVSEDALALARRNAADLGVADRVTFETADVFPSGQARYGVIISNPPYVPEHRLAELPPEYGHEPALGLSGGEDGLDVVRRILAGASTRLEPGGVLIVEVGESEQAVAAAWPTLLFTWLEFERGGSGVFLLTREELIAAGM